MREQKKDRTPAKGNGLIFGNHVKHGNSKLVKRAFQYNRQRRILAELERTLISGYSYLSKSLQGFGIKI